jgi:tRNA (5-methylaminomethyl-2-thiouridylate)-methyltransferase
VVPLTKEYWERVVAHSLGEIRAGRTPNPDVLCNSRIKFGAFLEHVAAAYPGAFDRVASGHYARITRMGSSSSSSGSGSGSSGVAPAPLLQLSEDGAKDQTYFLAGLSPSQLRSAMFPLGGLPKPAVRELAAAGRLPTAARKDSQGICFLGKVKFSEFVAQHLGDKPGPLIELESGTCVGTHRGFWFHTIGQRQGLGLPGGPWYVAAKDATRNVVFISRRYHDPDKRRNAFRAGSFSWLGDARPGQGAAAGVRVKVRHGARLYPCSLVWETPRQADAAAAAAAAAADALAAPLALPAAAQAPADGAPEPPLQPPPPPGLTARVVLDGNDQGLAVRPATRSVSSHASAHSLTRLLLAGGPVRGVLRCARRLLRLRRHFGGAAGRRGLCVSACAPAALDACCVRVIFGRVL